MNWRTDGSVVVFRTIRHGAVAGPGWAGGGAEMEGWTMTNYMSILKQNASPDVIAANPELFDGEQLSAAVSNGSDTGHVSIMPNEAVGKSAMEQKFIALWEYLGGPPLEPELRFHTSRRWRLDFCHLATFTAIELEGGAYSNGRHTRGSGFVGDCEKYNAANRLGYTVFRLATGMVTPSHIEPIIEYIRRQNA